MSIVGRRGGGGSGWTWYRPPPRRQPPLPPRPALPTAGLALILLVAGLTALAFWLSETGDSATPSPTLVPTLEPPVTPTRGPSPTPLPSPEPTPTSTPALPEPVLQLASWDGGKWQFSPRLEGAAYREGEAVPFLLRIRRASPGTDYPLTIRYQCRAFDLLTAYSRDVADQPGRAPGGPERVLPDTIISIPDDPGTPADDGGTGSLSLWGGSFAAVDGLRPPSTCADEKALPVVLSAAADTLFLLWGARLADGASQGAVPIRLSVQVPGRETVALEIAAEGVGPPVP